MHTVTKAERLQQVIAGGSVDRVPFSIWFHFGTQHLPGDRTVAIHVDFFQAYDLDWLKVMSDYRYPMPPGVVEVDSVEKLRRFSRFGMDAPAFAEQLKCLRAIRTWLGEDVPFVETVFSPWGVARRTLRTHYRKFWESYASEFKAFLESVTETLQRYVRAVADTGAAGIFYSINGLGEDEMSEAEFEEWVLPYDLAVLQTAEELAKAGKFYFNVAHLHGTKLRWQIVFQRYPAHAFNWSIHHSPPTLAEARRATRRALLVGIDEVGLAARTPSEVVAMVRQAIDEAGPEGLLIGPGCSVPTETPSDLIVAARDECRRRPTSSHSPHGMPSR